MPTIDLLLAEQQRQEEERKRRAERFAELKRLVESVGQPTPSQTPAPPVTQFQREQQAAQYLVPQVGNAPTTREAYEMQATRPVMPWPGWREFLLGKNDVLLQGMLPEEAYSAVKRIPLAGEVAEPYARFLTSPAGIATTLAGAAAPALGAGGPAASLLPTAKMTVAGTTAAIAAGSAGKGLEELGVPVVSVGLVNIGPRAVGEFVGFGKGGGKAGVLGMTEAEAEQVGATRLEQAAVKMARVTTAADATVEAETKANLFSRAGEAAAQKPVLKQVIRVIDPGKYWDERNPVAKPLRDLAERVRILVSHNQVAAEQFNFRVQKYFNLATEGEKTVVTNFARALPKGMSNEFAKVTKYFSDYEPYLTREQNATLWAAREAIDASNRYMLTMGVDPETLFDGASKVLGKGADWFPSLTYEDAQLAYRQSLSGKSPHWLKRSIETVAEDIETGKHLNYQDPRVAFATRLAASEGAVNWYGKGGIQDILGKYGLKPTQVAAKRNWELFDAAQTARREFNDASKELDSARAALNRLTMRETPEGMLTAELRRFNKAKVQTLEQAQQRVKQAEDWFASAKNDWGDIKNDYTELMKSSRRPSEGFTTLSDLKMGSRIYDKKFAQDVRILLGRDGGIVKDIAHAFNVVNTPLRLVMASGDLSWWAIQGLFGVAGAEPAYLKGLAIGYGSMFHPDWYFDRLTSYQTRGLLDRYFGSGGLWYGTDIPTHIRFSSKSAVAKAANAAAWPLNLFAEGFNRSSNIASVELFDSWTKLADDMVTLGLGKNVEKELRGLGATRAGLLEENRRLKTAVQEGRATAAEEARLEEVRTQLAAPTVAPATQELRAFGPARVARPIFGPVETPTVYGQYDQDIASVVNKATGKMNPAAVGITPTQRDIEGAVLFAPRYIRSFFGLIGDAMQGGMRGNRARYHIARGITGMVATYTLAAKALGQEPDFDPNSARFMSLRMAGTHIGVGGAGYGLIRAIANVKKANTFDQWLDMNNDPFMRYLRGRASPVLSEVWNIATGRDYIGNAITSPADAAQNVMLSTLPFALQSLAREGPAAALGQFAGMRSYPVLDWEWRDYYRNKAAEELTGVSGTKWSSLDKAQQKAATESTKSGPIAQHYAEKWRKSAAAKGSNWALREDSYNRFKTEQALSLSEALTNYNAGKITLDELAMARADIGQKLAQERDRLEAQYGKSEDTNTPQQFVEDNLADLYMFSDADTNADGIVTDQEWADHDTFLQLIEAKAEEQGINLRDYIDKRAGIMWGNLQLDSFEKTYQQAKYARNDFYNIPRWTGFDRTDSEKIDSYLRLIPAYAEKLRQTAMEKGNYPPEMAAMFGEALARQLLIANPPKGLNAHDKKLFMTAMNLSGNDDFRQFLDGGTDSLRFKFLMDKKQRGIDLIQWFPQIAQSLSAAELLPFGGSAQQKMDDILAETRVTTDQATYDKMISLIEEARKKAKRS